MPKWRVYYSDGSFTDDEVTRPFEVICIVQPRQKTGREVVNSFPYYILIDGIWRGVEDQTSLVQQVCLNWALIEQVCMGVWVSEVEFKKIIKTAYEAPGFLPRSANDQDRRR